MVSALDTGSSGSGSSRGRALRCVLEQDINSHSGSVHPGVQMGNGELLGVN